MSETIRTSIPRDIVAKMPNIRVKVDTSSFYPGVEKVKIPPEIVSQMPKKEIRGCPRIS
jgi:hypothetical protein